MGPGAGASRRGEWAENRAEPLEIRGGLVELVGCLLCPCPDVSISGANCPYELGGFIAFAVRNDGSISVAPGQRGRITLPNDGRSQLDLEFETPVRLFPGTSGAFTFAFQAPVVEAEPPFTAVPWVDADEEVNECDEENN